MQTLSLSANTISALVSRLRPPRAPDLTLVNQSGTALVGSVTLPELSPRYFTLETVTFAGVPLCSTCVHLVDSPAKGSYRFHGWVRKREFATLWPQGMNELRREVRFRRLFAGGFLVILLSLVLGFLVFVVGIDLF